MKIVNLRLKWQSNLVLRYLAVGSWNTLFSITILYILFFLFNNKFYEIELGVTFALSTVQSYFTQRLFVWKSSTSPKSEFSRFLIAVLFQYALNSTLLYILVNDLNLRPSYVALPIMVSVTCVFYFVNRNIVFKMKSIK